MLATVPSDAGLLNVIGHIIVRGCCRTFVSRPLLPFLEEALLHGLVKLVRKFAPERLNVTGRKGEFISPICAVENDALHVRTS